MMMKKRGKLENRKEDGNDKIRSMCSFNIEWKEMGTWKIKKHGNLLLKMMRLCSFFRFIHDQYFYFNPCFINHTQTHEQCFPW